MKNRKLIISITIIMITITTLGLSFAYYVARFSILNKDNSNSNIIAGSIVESILEVPTKDDNINILPGNKFSKEYIVKGKGNSNSLSTLVSLVVKPNLGQFSKYVYWKLYKSEEEITCEKNTCNIPESASLVLSGNNDNTHINITVNYDTNDKYYLITEYVNSDDDQSDLMNKTFNIDVTLEKVEDTIQNKIIAQLDTTGKCPTVNADGSVVTPTSIEDSDGYLCSAPDAYGTSYYYRGTVENNYVYFAGYYFRIVRINGDGSIRIIYDGTSAHANGEASDDRHIGFSAFNTDSKDNSKVGYMYGDNDGIVEGDKEFSTSTWTNTSTYYVAKEYVFDENTKKFTLKDPVAILGSDITSDYVDYYTNNSKYTPSSYTELYKITSVTASDENAVIGYKFLRYGTTSKEQAQTNTNNSTIKTYLDNWYKNNILGTEYEQYLADNLFCNDRSFSLSNTGTGAGVSYTRYRLHNPSKLLLTCPQQNDAFTVMDTTNGNGDLVYLVGLLTADEYYLAGSTRVGNDKFYLYTGNYEWLLPPQQFTGSGSWNLHQDKSGAINSYLTYGSGDGARPVINLKPNSLISGTGTMDNPYKVLDN